MKINIILTISCILLFSNAAAEDLKNNQSDQEILNEIRDGFKKEEILQKESEVHSKKAESLKKILEQYKVVKSYIIKNQYNVEKNASEEFYNFIKNPETNIVEKVSYIEKKIAKNRDLTQILKKLDESYGRSLNISEIFTIEKAALSGKFNKYDPTIKDDFWLAKESWHWCKQISDKISDPKTQGTYGQFRVALDSDDEVQGYLMMANQAYAVGLTKIRDSRN